MTGLLIALAREALNILVEITGYTVLGIGGFFGFVKLVNWRRRVTAPAALRAQVGDSTLAMLNRWKDEPGSIPDPLADELARLLTEGDKRA